MDTLSREQRSARMSQVRGKDTAPELIVRRLVHAMGYRYRLHRRDLPGCPDLALISRRKAMFVHGCFWHRHDDPACRLSRLPKSRLDFWKPKLDRNRERDTEKQKALRAMNWDFMVIWECQLKDRTSLTEAIRAFLEA